MLILGVQGTKRATGRSRIIAPSTTSSATACTPYVHPRTRTPHPHPHTLTAAHCRAPPRTVPSGPVLLLALHPPRAPRTFHPPVPPTLTHIRPTAPRRPQKATGSIERDENYVPRTRTDYGLPPAPVAHTTDYHDLFEETPIYSLARMLAMQLLGWHAYLLYNALGSPMYPEGTNHFWPSSPLFKPQERGSVIASNVGLSVMTSVLTYYIREAGIGMFVKMYFIPYLVRSSLPPYTTVCVH